MTSLEQIAFFQGRRDEVPNQKLARSLASSEDQAGIREIAENLSNSNQNVRSDCLKVLYEIGYLKPELIAEYVDDFLKLLKDKNNRMVWGGMIAMSTIAREKAERIWEQVEDIKFAIQHGSLITQVAGIKTLSRAASLNKVYSQEIFPFMLDMMRNSIPRDLITHAEEISQIVDESNEAEFINLLESRSPEMTANQLARLRKIVKKLEKELRDRQ